jgi:hypothetical protein
MIFLFVVSIPAACDRLASGDVAGERVDQESPDTVYLQVELKTLVPLNPPKNIALPDVASNTAVTPRLASGEFVTDVHASLPAVRLI